MIRAAFAALLLFSAPAFSQYRAAPLTAPAEAKFVAKDILWKCGAGDCVAGRSGSRPAIVCAALAREVGPLGSFSAAGRPLDAAELEKCNARAKR